MAQKASDQYLRNAVMTATPEQLQLMLYDGAIRFANQAREAMTGGDYETSCEKLIRAERIVLEMQNGLRHEVNPDLCKKLSALYEFVYHHLVEANLERDPTAIDKALTILHHQRETWQLLIDKIRDAGGSEANATGAGSHGPDDVGATLSIQG